MSFIAIRIGLFQPKTVMNDPAHLDMMDSFLSRRDLNQLIGCCIDTERVRFAIFHALSDNRFKRLDISDARELVGYAPEDDFTSVNPAQKDFHLAEIMERSNQSSGKPSGIREDL